VSAERRRRVIAKVGVETPLLLPSFSSRGFPGVAAIIDALRVDVSSACLFSAFDVAHGFAPSDFLGIADVVCVDSGGYETTASAVAVDCYLPDAAQADWTRERYRSFLRSSVASVITNVIAVSYDTYASVDEQVEQAREDFAGIPGAATDFLLKPETRGDVLRSVGALAPSLRSFDVIGITERELGTSALERCRSLIALRRALQEAGLDTPIHVFGAITPAAVTTYFLSGADIFDGLNWLRVALDEPWGASSSEFAVTGGLTELDDEGVLLVLWRRNLRALQRVQRALRRFSSDGDRLALSEALPFAALALAVADEARRQMGSACCLSRLSAPGLSRSATTRAEWFPAVSRPRASHEEVA